MPYKEKGDEYKEHVKRRSKAVKDWRIRTKQRIIQCMGGCCQICSYSRCQKALELHHIDPSDKERSFSQLMAHPTAIEGWIDEIKKCVLVCSNCHREIHDGITELPDTYKCLDEELFRSLTNRPDITYTDS